MPALVQVRNLWKTYSSGEIQLHALRDVSVDIQSGEFVAIMGPSGSGKSTFMNILGCLDNPSWGTVDFDGERLDLLSRDRLAEIRNRKIGFVFQQFNLLPRMTAVKNVALPLLYAPDDTRDPKQTASAALAAVGLAGRELSYPNQLSGGQQQRVAIARSLVNNPRLILADEPTGQLDSHTSIEIMAIFQRLNQAGITIVLVTHEPDIAEFAKRIIRFLDGCIEADEPVPHPLVAEEILAHRSPQTEAHV